MQAKHLPNSYIAVTRTIGGAFLVRSWRIRKHAYGSPMIDDQGYMPIKTQEVKTLEEALALFDAQYRELCVMEAQIALGIKP